MRDTKLLMGMPILAEIVDSSVTPKDIEEVFLYFKKIDNHFSTYKKDSEISKINKGEIGKNQLSSDTQRVLDLAEKTKQETNGYFDMQKPDGSLDPSGLVKGWAIWQVAKQLQKKGFKNFFINAGGDIQAKGNNTKGKPWRVGIKNPFNQKEIVKVVLLIDKGIATSGSYIRGQHVYNPHLPGRDLKEIVSLSVIGPNIYEADRFATAAFAMQEKGIQFIEQLPGFEGYMIDKDGIATMTSGFEKYV